MVDSPANPIDNDIRANIGQLVPSLTGQFIAFMISSERGRFLESLRRASTGDIQYITVFRKSVRHLAEKAVSNRATTTTRDGLVVHDAKFFDEFQLDSEEG